MYRREMAGWSYIGVWRSLRRGCLPLTALAIAGPTLVCSGLCLLTIIPSAIEDELWSLIPLALLVGLVAAERLFGFTNSLVVTALSATAISAELEAETYPLLRLTLIPAREIVAAKFGAVVAQVRTPTIALILVRVLILATIVLFFASSMFSLLRPVGSLGGPVTPQIVAPPAAFELPTADVFKIMLFGSFYLTAAALVILTALLWLLYYLLGPMFEVFLFTSLGLFASSLVRSRGNGLLAAGGMRLVFWMGSYMAGQFFSTFFSLLMLPLSLIPVMPHWIQTIFTEPSLMITGLMLAALFLLAILISAQMGVVLGLLGLTHGRAKQLPFRSTP